jgi:Thioredoxin reductase
MRNVTIIGSGCAGWTAAIYTARANLNPLLVTGIQPGGLLTTTTVVENFPGFSKGIDEGALMTEMQEQAARFGTEVKYLTKVVSVDFSKQPLRIDFDSGESVESRSVIIATGARHRHLGVRGEHRLENKGVTYCATCDGALRRDRPPREPLFRAEHLSRGERGYISGVVPARDRSLDLSGLEDRLKQSGDPIFECGCLAGDDFDGMQGCPLLRGDEQLDLVMWIGESHVEDPLAWRHR